MKTGRWGIETRTPAVDDPLAYVPAGPWTRDTLGEEARAIYTSKTAAERQIRALRKLGDEWAEREYRAREVGGATSPESARSSRAGSIRMTPAAWAALDAYAARLGVGRGAAVAALVRGTK